MAPVSFRKMHGLGNDFVVIDARHQSVDLTPDSVRALADRRLGIGCDQLIVFGEPTERLADVAMAIHNADGGEVAACGNATRCVASLALAETDKDHVIIETRAGLLDAERTDDGRVAVDMGLARLDWRDIPLAEAVDTLHLPVSAAPLADPVAVSMGNPHAVFFVDDVVTVELATLGPVLETDAMFPERANIGIAQVTGPDRLRLRVWERGAGLTRACGTGACAAAVAAARRGLTGRRVTVELPGGVLDIDWLPDDHVMMTGPVAFTFAGTVDIAALTAPPTTP